MGGLTFSLASFVNVVAGGLIGAGVTILVGWCSTRELRKHIYESFDRQAQLVCLAAQGIPFTLQINEDNGRVSGYEVKDRDIPGYQEPNLCGGAGGSGP